MLWYLTTAASLAGLRIQYISKHYVCYSDCYSEGILIEVPVVSKITSKLKSNKFSEY